MEGSSRLGRDLMYARHMADVMARKAGYRIMCRMHLSKHLITRPKKKPRPMSVGNVSVILKADDPFYWDAEVEQDVVEDLHDSESEYEFEECEGKDASFGLVMSKLSIELLVYSQTLLENESYLRDAIVDGLRYDHDYCLVQNLYRFKVKMVLGCKDLFWRWKSYDSYVRRNNKYHDDLEACITKLKRDMPNTWRAADSAKARYLWHTNELCPFSDEAAMRIGTIRDRLDRKYPIHLNVRRYLVKQPTGAAVYGSVVLSRAAFYQRDRMLFALFKNFLTAPVKDPHTGNPVPLEPRSYHRRIEELASQDGNPCLVFAATRILEEAPDVSRSCAVPRHLPGMRPNCCDTSRVPWYSNLTLPMMTA